jgi:non-heme chloroperoxidase
MIERAARLPGGVLLPYVEYGRGDGEPLVLVHGLADHWRSYLPVLPHFPEQLRAFAVTQRGHGGASQPMSGYSIGELAGDLLAFLDAVGVERAVLAGHSLGSAASLGAAIDSPGRVSGLVLAPGFAKLPATEAAFEMITGVHALTDPIDRRFVEWLQEQASDEHMPAGMFDAMVEHTLCIRARTLQALVDSVRSFDVGDRLSEVTTTTMLIWGDRDAFVDHESQARLLAELRDAELVIFQGAGHTPHWDDPARFAAEVARFAGVAAHG